jgi:hypothetical protein
MSIEITTPLQWPEGLAHTPRGKQSMLNGFAPTMTIEDAIRYLDDEVLSFKLQDVVLTTHIEHFASPRLRKLENISSAIGVLFKHEGERYLLPCDRWLLPQHNIYGIVMTLRQIRALDGYGVLSGNTLFHHFLQKKKAAAQTSHSADVVVDAAKELEPWRLMLGLGPSATVSDANAVYRARARSIGDHDSAALSALNEAIEKARRNLSE